MGSTLHLHVHQGTLGIGKMQSSGHTAGNECFGPKGKLKKKGFQLSTFSFKRS